MTRILFLEDELTISEVTAEYMRIQGYKVSCAGDGGNALALFKDEDFDLAILDIMVPKVNGIEVLKYIRREKPSMAVIMLMALGEEKTQLEAFNLNADDFIVKPFSPILLLKRIEAVLRRTLAGRKNKHMTAGFHIDSDSYQAYYAGKRLELTLSEFLLLQNLYHEPNRVFTAKGLLL